MSEKDVAVKKIWLVFLAIGCLTTWSYGQDQQTDRASPQNLKIELQKPADSAAISYHQNAAVIDVASHNGIGSATLTRLGAQWPMPLTIRIKLVGLASFGMNNGIVRFHTTFGHEKMPYWKVGKNGEEAVAPDGQLEIPITREGGVFEITVPKEMTAGNPENMNFSWIDVYRR